MSPIDLRTDSGPPPTDRMRELAADVTAGYGGIGEGPGFEDVEREVADLVGMDAAVLVPTGTMANQIAARVHAPRGSEVIVERESHLYTREVAGLAQLSGLQARPVDGGARGVPTPEVVVENCFPGEILNQAATGLLALEDTHNVKGGLAIAPEAIDAAAGAAHGEGVPVHLDGARLVRAAAALDRPLDRFCERVDSVYVDLAKLGAPAGSVLAGSEAFVRRARRERQVFGGHLKATGFLAAPALEALASLDKLAADHDRAARLAAALSELDGLSVQEPETNLVFVDVEATGLSPERFVAACEERGVLCKAFGGRRVRFCTHRGVDDAAIDGATERIRGALETAPAAD